ncbi:MAG: glycosyltransferase family 2 protein [Dehalococcoidales bacterium]|nr:glycosyltransferase family 2 protein [Dehalococcoidales bacterium]
MPDRTKVSVIIPVYNAEKYLYQCLDSVINQSLRDIEIICIDDYSTDNSLSILCKYADRDKRIRIIKNNQRLKAGESRNKGIGAAVGEYIHFLDADDYLVDGSYEKLYRLAAVNDLDLVIARTHGIDASTVKEVYNPIDNLSYLSPSDFNNVTSFSENPKKFVDISVSPWNALYKRSLITENNIYFNSLMCVNDRSFCVTVTINARRVIFADSYIIYHRDNILSSLVGLRSKYFECHFASYRMIEDLCTNLPSNLKYIILENELHDLFYWFRKFQSEHILEHDTLAQTQDFIHQLDISPFGKTLLRCRWYKQYLKIKNPIVYQHNLSIIERFINTYGDSLQSHKMTAICYRFLVIWDEEGFMTALEKAYRYIFH